uniref:Reverse transcriptase domain-containing protein n=1 Tax=Tanacetum cinerariifolium TaxID=118510 RepID=A0A6L2J6F6_TANCI|nr:hypothetical protein [Tanacetum cinerariifolium]
MSSASSAVTYTSVYTDSEPGRVFWGADEELSDGGSSRVIVYEYDGLSMQPVAPPSTDYIPEPMYPVYIPLKDKHVLSTEEQPLPPIDSPTVELSGYVAELDLEEDPEEYEDDKTEDGLVYYPIDEGDNGDDDDGDLSGDDTDDEDEDEEEEEEHLTSTDSAIVIPNAAISLPPEAEALIDAVTAALPSPPLPPPLYIPPPVNRKDDIPETKIPPRKRLCLSTLGSRYEIKESSMAIMTKGRGIDYGFVSTLDVEARQRGIREVWYGIRDPWVDPAEAVPEIAPMTVGKVNTRVTEIAELHEHDIHDLYALLEDAQDTRTRISQQVTIDSQRVDLLMKDRTVHQEAILIVDEEAYAT